MITDFKLTGLSKPQSFTCEPLNGDTIFWAKNGLGKEKFNELWNYCNGNWSDKKIAEIQHNGIREDGTPINPVVIGIRELQQHYTQRKRLGVCWGISKRQAGNKRLINKQKVEI